MKKKGIVVLLTLLIFFSATILGVSTVFRVDGVAVDASVFSELADEEAKQLQKRLYEVYGKDSTIFANDKEAKTVLKEFPYLRLVGFEKNYPNKIVVKVTEDEELYAVSASETDEDFYIISADGIVMERRSSPNNRLDGEPLITVKGLAVTGTKGQKLNGGASLETFLSFCARMSEKLNGLRDNVVAVEISAYSPEYCLTTREGVKIYVGSPMDLTREKADAAVEKYLELSDNERRSGSIAVVDKGGNVIASYDPKGFQTK